MHKIYIEIALHIYIHYTYTQLHIQFHFSPYFFFFICNIYISFIFFFYIFFNSMCYSTKMLVLCFMCAMMVQMINEEIPGSFVSIILMNWLQGHNIDVKTSLTVWVGNVKWKIVFKQLFEIGSFKCIDLLCIYEYSDINNDTWIIDVYWK